MPDPIQFEAEEGAGQNLVDDLVPDQDHGLTAMAGFQTIQQGKEACLNVPEAFASRKANLTGSGTPQAVQRWVGGGGFGVSQTLELAIVDIQQADVFLNRLAQSLRKRCDGLLGTQQRTAVQGSDRFTLQPSGDGAGLGLTSSVQGQIGPPPESLCASAGVPCGLAVPDQDKPGHAVSPHTSGAILA
jgi:hypothetical protein